MKKLFMIFGFLAVVICFPVKTYAITRYIINNGKVYYQRLKFRDEMTEADAQTFKNLDYFYAKDKNYVYYQEKLVKGADSDTLKKVELNAGNSKILDFGSTYASDKNSVYFKNMKIEGADPASFVMLEQGYYKDKRYLYFYGKRLEGSDSRKEIKFIKDNKDTDCIPWGDGGCVINNGHKYKDGLKIPNN